MKNGLSSYHSGPSSTFPFLSLPFELRVLIYSYGHKWPDIRYLWKDQNSWILYQREKLYKQSKTPDSHSATRSRLPRCQTPVFKVKYSTPTILLLNRQISDEAIEVIYNTPLYLKTPSSGLDIPRRYRILDITKFFSRGTLQKLRRVHLDMKLTIDLKARGFSCVAGWPGIIHGLVDAWEERNRLERIEACGCYEPVSKDLGWSFRESAHHTSVIILLSKVG